MRYASNPFIAETCSHYPEAFAVGSTAGKKTCDCADCFYCDNELEDYEDDRAAAQATRTTKGSLVKGGTGT